MKKVFFLSLLLLGTITAAGAELRSALLPKPVKINWYIEQLTSKPGEEETYQTVTPAKSPSRTLLKPEMPELI